MVEKSEQVTSGVVNGIMRDCTELANSCTLEQLRDKEIAMYTPLLEKVRSKLDTMSNNREKQLLERTYLMHKERLTTISNPPPQVAWVWDNVEGVARLEHEAYLLLWYNMKMHVEWNQNGRVFAEKAQELDYAKDQALLNFMARQAKAAADNGTKAKWFNAFS